MANISVYLQQILDAVYGEDVRSSIYNAIDLINKVGEVNIAIGTDVTSATSPSTSYYDGSVYINNETWDIWKCKGPGSGWTREGNIRGGQGIQGEKGDKGDQGYSIVGFDKTSTLGLVDTYTVKNSAGSIVGTFDVTNGEKGDKGDTGNTGFSPTITYTKSGKVAIISITDVNGTRSLEIKDGDDGDGSGDMLMSTYDTDGDGVVDLAKQLAPGSVDDYPTSGSNNLVKSSGLYSQIGDLTQLNTEAKSNLVEAINEAAESAGHSDEYVQKSGDTMTGPLTTTTLTVGSRKSNYKVGSSSLGSGDSVVASGDYSHAEGGVTTASGHYSHAEGSGTFAMGQASHAEGLGTTAGSDYQHVQGKYNNNKSTNAFEIGNGTASNKKSNALEVTWNGDLKAYGEIEDGNGIKLSDMPVVTYGTDDLEDGVSELATGTFYFVYEE